MIEGAGPNERQGDPEPGGKAERPGTAQRLNGDPRDLNGAAAVRHLADPPERRHHCAHRGTALVAGRLATKHSPHTRAAYLRDLAQWADWLAGHDVPLLEADETATAMWARHPETAE